MVYYQCFLFRTSTPFFLSKTSQYFSIPLYLSLVVSTLQGLYYLAAIIRVEILGNNVCRKGWKANKLYYMVQSSFLQLQTLDDTDGPTPLDRGGGQSHYSLNTYFGSKRDKLHQGKCCLLLRLVAADVHLEFAPTIPGVS